MKKIFTILIIFAVFILLSATLNLNDSSFSIYGTDSVYYTGNIVTTDTFKGNSLNLTNGIFYTPAHTSLTYKDSATVITGGTNVQITNAYDSLYRVNEAVYVTYKLGDTLIPQKKGGYFILCSLYGYGNSAADWQATYAYKRGATTYYGNNTMEFTTTGAVNKDGTSAVFYVELEINDKVWLVITRTSGAGNFTTTTGSFNLDAYYLMK